MKNTNQLYAIDLKNIQFDHSYRPYDLTSTNVDSCARPYARTPRNRTPRDHAPRDRMTRKSTSCKRRQERSTINVYMLQLIMVTLCTLILWVSFTAIYNSLCLLSIGCEVSEMGVVLKTDSNYPRYQELQNERANIKNSSWIGYLLVVAGGNWFSASIRVIVVLLLAIIAVPKSISYIKFVIKVDIKHLKKNFGKIARYVRSYTLL